MADPLLSSLCTICHVNLPRYTCPRCSTPTCSLPCVRRHKLWSSCSGTRDPTVYKPRSELLTASSVDHDYNFLRSIEHQIERSEKEIVEENGLLRREELGQARVIKAQPDRSSRQKKLPAGEACIDTKLKMLGTRVHRAPKGMQRSAENGTSWSKNNREIFWQVEWMREAGTQRQLGKILANKSIAHYYDEWFEEDRRSRLSGQERQQEKKRKASEFRGRVPKRVRFEALGRRDMTELSRTQDPVTGAWSITSPPPLPTNIMPLFSPDTYRRTHNHQLYLLRPLTSTKFPKVLVPVDPTKSLGEILRRRDVLEFPTIYVFENPIEELPEEFMLETKFLKVTGQGVAEDESDESSSDGDEDTSDSSESDMEDGEIDE